MTTSAVTALQVEDEDFIIASLIERCPKSMMIRELMMNALEFAQHAPEGSNSNAIVGPTVRWMISCMSAPSWFTSVGFGSSVCRRENASSL